MNNDLAAENHELQYDNKQLSSMLKEYEATLESVMNAFRGRAVRKNACLKCEVC